MNFTGIDHFVLTAEDLERSCEFYESLGGDVVTFGEGHRAVRFGEQKINIHPTENDIDPVAAEPTPGGGDFCLVTEMSIEEVQRRLRDRDIEIIKGPVERPGARGHDGSVHLTSVYFRDPDGNLVEIGTYGED